MFNSKCFLQKFQFRTKLIFSGNSFLIKNDFFWMGMTRFEKKMILSSDKRLLVREFFVKITVCHFVTWLVCRSISPAERAVILIDHDLDSFVM